jgi:hypothetical protein
MPTWATDLRFLAENEFGFAPDVIGFPSISACRAVVYQTEHGLIGFHQASGAHPYKFERFGRKFASFVRDVQRHVATGRGLNLYCAAKVGAGGSYASALEHKQELEAFAEALDFHGPIRSYDLTHKWADTGVYVELRIAGDLCDMYGNPWVEHHDDTHRGTVATDQMRFHKISSPNRDDFQDPNRVWIKVDTTGQEQVEPIRLP